MSRSSDAKDSAIHYWLIHMFRFLLLSVNIEAIL